MLPPTILDYFDVVSVEVWFFKFLSCIFAIA